MLVNYNHTTCPKCSSAISDGGKTCGSCGAVRSSSSSSPNLQKAYN